MTPEELITLQQLEIEGYKMSAAENKAIVDSLKLKFYAIGAPLNDNCLKFNNEQLKWCFRVVELIEEIEC